MFVSLYAVQEVLDAKGKGFQPDFNDLEEAVQAVKLVDPMVRPDKDKAHIRAPYASRFMKDCVLVDSLWGCAGVDHKKHKEVSKVLQEQPTAITQKETLLHTLQVKWSDKSLDRSTVISMCLLYGIDPKNVLGEDYDPNKTVGEYMAEDLINEAKQEFKKNRPDKAAREHKKKTTPKKKVYNGHKDKAKVTVRKKPRKTG